MRTTFNFARVVIVTIVTLFSLSISAQRTWNTHGIHADSSDYLGTINNEPLRIKTDSVDRIIVGVNDSIQFKGTAIFDSVKIPNGFLQADSIRARIIRVGDSSLILGGQLPTVGGNLIRTTQLGGQTLIIVEEPVKLTT